MSLLKVNQIQPASGTVVELKGAQTDTGGDVVGTTDTQALTNKTINGSDNTLILGDAAVGIVSESAGTPTGAVIERGSNANGEYVRFADGTMVCTKTVATVGTDAALATASSFINAEYIAHGIDTGSTSRAHICRASTVGTFIATRYTLPSWGASSGPGQFVIIGRWY